MKIKRLLSRNVVLFTLLLSLFFIVISSKNYPGGNIIDAQSIGYSFKENYISNLLDEVAINGEKNAGRPFGIVGVVLMGFATALAFVRFANKIEQKKYALPIRMLGLILLLITALITISSLHDSMVTLGSVFTILLFFYSTMFLWSTKQHALKFVALIFLVFFYGAAYMYFTRSGLYYLPLVQKIIHILQVTFILLLEYKYIFRQTAPLKSESK